MTSKFFKLYRPQSFTLPDSVVYYITKKPSNPAGYQKLIQSCKYFFCINPILIFHCLIYKDNEWKICLNDGRQCLELCKTVDINNSVAKLWITKTLSIIPLSLNTSFTSSCIRKLYKYDDITALTLKNQVVHIDELVLFSSTVNLFLHQTSVISKNGSLIAIPKIIDSFPFLRVFYFGFDDDNASIFTQNTVKEILQIPHFHKFVHLILFRIPETFDIQTFYEYLKKNQKTEFVIAFANTISQEYRNRLEAIVDEILSIESHNYKVPCIIFPEMDVEKRKKLKMLSDCCLRSI